MSKATGLLIVTNPSKISRILPVIQQYVNNLLYVQYYPNRHSLSIPSNLEVAATAPRHGKTIIGLYSQTNSLCQNLDVRVLLRSTKDPSTTIINTEKPLDIVIFDRIFNTDEINYFMNTCIGNKNEKCETVTLGEEETKHNEFVPVFGNQIKYYDNVVLGGTFDRLHAGHKILLSEAVLRCTSQLTVGVTDTSMLLTKKLWELIEPCEQRMSAVREFLHDIDPLLTYKIVPISDPFGPTKEDPELEVKEPDLISSTGCCCLAFPCYPDPHSCNKLIVVSAETSRGGQAVNKLRNDNGLSTLAVLEVELLTSDLDAINNREENEEDKISSSNQRLRMLGTRLRPITPKPHLPHRPYIIGLTGGIASGKSSIADFLCSLGAGLVTCDTLAHGLYAVGRPLHSEIRAAFGEGVVAANGEIDRRALGAIVFADQSQLERLNALVWPALWAATTVEVTRLHAEGKQVVVVEAAILLQAGWAQNCHEVWTSVIPADEAVRRLAKRNSLSEDEARRRIDSQPSNSEQIAIADIVVTTLWSVDYTRRQVTRAWNALQEQLDAE